VVDSVPASPLQEFTLEALGRCDGLDGSPSFIGFRGKVYDVSKSFLWSGGRHEAMHQAGMDLTQALVGAPHGADLLEKYPVVGILLKKPRRQTVGRWRRRR
jgi:predicted heme/steroid binding protein